jgi:hypothetical protein
MQSLFNGKVNWFVYLGVIIFIRLVWPGLGWVSFFALCITLHQFFLLFYSIGYVLPIRYLLGTFMCVQMLLGPTFAYNGLDAYLTDRTFQMKIPEAEYFSYVMPAVILFILGLHVTAGKLKGEILNVKEITRFVDNSGDLPYYFIGIGFLSGYISGHFGSELAFVFYLVASFKYIGAFMILFGTRQLKTWVLVLVFGSIILSSLQGGMFHDLLTWLIMLGAVFAIRYKPSLSIKALGASCFILLSVIIQQVKGDYRKAAWNGGGGIEAFQNSVAKDEEDHSLFSVTSLAQSNVRINQGFIITNIMSHVPEVEPFSNGEELWRILQAAFLPRILAPNKLNAGDRGIFMQYTGMYLSQGTSMALSSVGDAYINFGTWGGCIFMFFLGLTFSEVLNGFYRYSKYYPFLLLFTTLVFYYPIRPDCELQTSLGHLVKSCFLIYMLILFWKKDISKMIRKKSAVQPAVN